MSTQVIYEGKESLRDHLGAFIFLNLISIGTLGILYVLSVPAMVWLWLSTKSNRYLVTEDRIEYEHGVLSKSIDVMELWRINDVRFSQSFMQRLTSVCTIYLVTQDKTSPLFAIRGINPKTGKEVFVKLQAAVSKSRTKQRVLALTS